MIQTNKEQQRAIDFHNGTLLLLAGPGSGKTFVLTHRIKALLDSGVDASHILVITFTKAAAVQMKERFNKLDSSKASNVTFGTFHSIFYSILKNHRAYAHVEPITDKEKLNMIKRAFEIAQIEEDYCNSDDYIQTLSLISACKNNGAVIDDFRQDKFDVMAFKNIYCAYNDLLHEFKKIDFDDMINSCLELLKSDKSYCERWQSRFEYICIDEFQDISGNQYELIKLLAYPEWNIFAVGDDDQSIYRFRGARVEIMHNLLKDVSGAKKELLSVNFRSSKAIVDAAGVVISENKKRFHKDIKANSEILEPVKIYGCSGLDSQYKEILNQILSVSKDININDIAILLRTNRQATRYCALLRANDIPVCFYEKTAPFSSVYIYDICAYLAIAHGDESRGNFLRIMNKPLRYIKRDAVNSGIVTEKNLLSFYSSDINMQQRIHSLFVQINRIRSMSPFLAIHYIRNTVGYDSYVKINTGIEEYERYLNEIDSFTEIVKKCKSYYDFTTLVSQLREKGNDKKTASGINVMTYHGSKGLEFDTVILPDCNDGITPAKVARSEEEIEEERRMFYVAITRAKNRLILTYRTDENKKRSRFIEPLLKKEHSNIISPL